MDANTLSSFFQSSQTVFPASAPGRLDVMGGIADYSGSLVLQMPIKERTNAWAALRQDGMIRVCSQTIATVGHVSEAQYALNDLAPHPDAIDYATVRTRLMQNQEAGWAAYVIGCALVLMKEKQIPIPGVDILLDSQVPIGKGVSSSAAIEVAVMRALAAALNLCLGDVELPVLAQRVENYIVGAPCGIMDQLASYLGRENRLLPILCQPHEVRDTVAIPSPLCFVGIDSGVRHAVSGASYGEVRTAAFMGYSIIAQAEGASRESLTQARKTGRFDSFPYQGYLANIDPGLFKIRYASLLPDSMSGQDFLDRYGETIDTVTAIEPHKTYAIRDCTRHPVGENARVTRFANLLQSLHTPTLIAADRKKAYIALGELMAGSHESYSACGLGCEATDAIVRAVQDAGPDQGVYGAKITGGGSGGTVCVLCEGETGIETAKTITQTHAQRFGIEPYLFQGSSEGACWS